MSAAWKRRLAELGRFLTVGGVATAVALVIFNLLVHGVPGVDGAPMATQPIFAYVIANSVGMVVSFAGSRNWAFSDREPIHRDGGFTAYMVINLATFVLPMACLWVSRDVLGRTDPISDNIAANVIGGILGTLARYYLFRTLVFRRPVPLVDMYDELAEESAASQAPPASPAPPASQAPLVSLTRLRRTEVPRVIRLGSRAIGSRATARRDRDQSPESAASGD